MASVIYLLVSAMSVLFDFSLDYFFRSPCGLDGPCSPLLHQTYLTLRHPYASICRLQFRSHSHQLSVSIARTVLSPGTAPTSCTVCFEYPGRIQVSFSGSLAKALPSVLSCSNTCPSVVGNSLGKLAGFWVCGTTPTSAAVQHRLSA